jgi:hypothetical protein
MKYVRLTFSLAAYMLIFSQRCFSREEINAEPSFQNMSQVQALGYLNSTDRGVRLQSAIQLDLQRSLLIQKLIDVLKSTNSADVKAEAVIVLGEYRATEAVPILVKNIEWDDLMRINSPPSGHMVREDMEELTGPVSGALLKIGSPAVQVLVDRIAETDDTNVAAKCVRICYSIEGLEIVQFRLQSLLAKQTDQKRKGRIQSALEVLHNLSSVK